ncbi:LacI family DNA-binding transcriptional regulator [Streptomyces millisiae]|uniref:Substrate-binding domain-containing protein n=1 Tax=Streptomyces millisiae TaxID=3075542 RepID=A0ABU2LWN9_9ACTN|nr:substrate-binding domain-containing protein [Streptomyces sp. DSM 44918]MDT0321998.1 substrate-binding domain-containing protein [Streptomyces sp. DSM 44918]
MAGRVSMREIAERAGVSQKTVSRVVNGEPHVSRELRERVEREIARLGYLPDASARALVTRRSRRIGILTTDTGFFGPASVLRDLERAARNAGYFVSVVHADDRDPQETARSVRHLVSQGVEALAVSAPVLGVLDQLTGVPAGVPVLRMEFPEGPARPGVIRVGSDDASSAREATAHLLALGHRTVHHIAGPPSWSVTARRIGGWRAALRAAGAPEPAFAHGDWSAAAGCRIARELLADADVTALFVANDQMAIGAMYAVQRSGRRVPEDVSVVGFDDIPEAAYLSVPLTTVRQDFTAMAEQGMRRLVAAVTADGRPPGPSDDALIPGTFVVRESTAPPARPSTRRAALPENGGRP